MDIRGAVLNDNFSRWISEGVEKLYLNLDLASDIYESAQPGPKLLSRELLPLALEHFDLIFKLVQYYIYYYN